MGAGGKAWGEEKEKDREKEREGEILFNKKLAPASYGG